MGWSIMRIIARTVGAMQYGLPQLHRGSLSVGDPMPDVTLTDYDGKPFRLADLGVDRPLVLIFGSYT